MAQETLQPRKRGPAPTGKGTPIQVRVQPDLMAGVDAFIEERRAYGEDLTRPEALRTLAAEALVKMGMRKHR